MSADEPDAMPEHVAVYRRVRDAFGDPSLRSRDSRRRRRSAREETSAPFGAGREPHGLSDVVESLTRTMGWESPLAQSELLLAWPELVGAETAAHTSPIGIEHGMLTVRCDSTAWATQLRTMRSRVGSLIAERFPEAGVESVRFLGPDVPTFKRGPRTVPGRGPRDTYG